MGRIHWVRAAFAYVDTRPSLSVAALALATVAISFVVYWPSLDDYFVYDDFFFLRAVRNHSFPTVMLRAVTFPSIQRFDEVTLFWRPLIDVYFYLFRPLGLRPEPYHAVNVALHGATGALGVMFIYRVTGSIVKGAFSGLLFTVAPTYDIAVSWISQVSELLAATLILGVFLSYRSYLVSERHALRFLWLTAGLVVLAFLTKESTIVLLPLVPAMLIVVPPDKRTRDQTEIVRSLGPLFALGIVFGILTFTRQTQGAAGSYEIGPHMFGNFRDYLEWMVLPFESGSYSIARTILARAFVVAGGAALLLRHRVLTFLFIWTVVALLPFTGFVFPFAARYTYLATLPFVAFVVTGTLTVAGSLPEVARRPCYAVLLLAVLVALIVTPMRTRDQQDSLALQAAGYEVMVSSVRALCGPVSSGGRIFVNNPPYRDLWSIHTVSALNLYYERVDAYPVTGLPGLIFYVENKCVIEYEESTGQYHRVTEF